MTVKRMDNVGIVVEDIDAAIEFFTELGLELEGRAPIEGDWADGVTGLRDMRVEIAMMRTPDGHSRLEMSRFLARRLSPPSPRRGEIYPAWGVNPRRRWAGPTSPNPEGVADRVGIGHPYRVWISGCFLTWG